MNPITPGRENYLKVLLALSGQGPAHVSLIARALAVSKASVSAMMKRLRAEGYITQEKYGTVTLTERGREDALNVQKRYDLLKTYLTAVLGVDAETAAQDACRIEHSISPETMTKMEEHLFSIRSRERTESAGK